MGSTDHSAPCQNTRVMFRFVLWKFFFFFLYSGRGRAAVRLGHFPRRGHPALGRRRVEKTSVRETPRGAPTNHSGIIPDGDECRDRAFIHASLASKPQALGGAHAVLHDAAPAEETVRFRRPLGAKSDAKRIASASSSNEWSKRGASTCRLQTARQFSLSLSLSLSLS